MSREAAAVAALLRAGRRPWAVYAEQLEQTGTARVILEQEQGLLSSQLIDAAEDEIARWDEQGIRLVTLLDSDYPENLRAVYDRTPLLFVSGSMRPSDARSVAVIGSRRPSAAGLRRARAISERLIDGGYAIVSGLASGIDTTAHMTALDRGARTIAVLGTGLHHAYPRQNGALQRKIALEGAVVSRFWPETPPARQNFPLRNAVMSGIALASIVVEATRTSGARTQIRAALAHGRPVVLASALLDQPWARELAARPGVHVIRSLAELDEVLGRLTATDALVA